MNIKKTLSISDEVWKSFTETRDVQIRNFIMMEYLYVVKFIAIRLYPTYKNFVDQDDMISCGSLALLNAVERFDYTRDVKFETFASIRVRGAMIDYLRQQDWVPRTIRKNIKDIDSAYRELHELLGRPPEDSEICEKLGIKTGDYYDTLSKTYGANIMSIEELLAENANFIIPSSDSLPDVEVEKNELADALALAIDSLGEKERIIVSLYYFEGLKAKQIAAVLEISESRVSQIHSKALIKLKYVMQKYMEE